MPENRKLLSGLRFGKPSRLHVAGIRQLAKSEPEAFMRKVQANVDAGLIRLSDIQDFKVLYQALADVEVPVVIPDATGMERAVTSSAFPVLVGTTVVAAINEAYQAVPTIGQDLVTELDDKKTVTVIARLSTLDNQIEQVKEGEDYPEISAAEDTVEIAHRPNGRMIRITAQAIEQNDVANIVERINALGNIAATRVEKLTLQRVSDLYGSAAAAAAPYVYRPAGANTALFSAAVNTPGTRAPLGTRLNNNAFVDETDVGNVRTRLAAMRDDNNDPIPMDPNSMVVLVPDALLETSMKVKNSVFMPVTPEETNMWGPQGAWAGWKLKSSPYLDLWSASAWYAGYPKKQFRRKWALRFEYVTLGDSTETYLRSRIAFQARVAWDCEVGAVDYVHWVQCLAVATPPSA